MTCENVLTETESERKTPFFVIKKQNFYWNPSNDRTKVHERRLFFFTRFFDHLARQKQVFFGPLRALGLSASKLKQQIFWVWMTWQQDRCTDTSNLLISFTQDGSYSSSKNILVTKMSISTYCNEHCLPKPSIEEQHSVAMATANVHEQRTGATEYITELSHLSLSLVIQGVIQIKAVSLFIQT